MLQSCKVTPCEPTLRHAHFVTLVLRETALIAIVEPPHIGPVALSCEVDVSWIWILDDVVHKEALRRHRQIWAEDFQVVAIAVVLDNEYVDLHGCGHHKQVVDGFYKDIRFGSNQLDLEDWVLDLGQVNGEEWQLLLLLLLVVPQYQLIIDHYPYTVNFWEESHLAQHFRRVVLIKELVGQVG